MTKNKVEQFNHWNTDEIVCPHCGYEHSDSWDYDWSQSECKELECGECLKPFDVYRQIDISYTTSKKKDVQKHD